MAAQRKKEIKRQNEDYLLIEKRRLVWLSWSCYVFMVQTEEDSQPIVEFLCAVVPFDAFRALRRSKNCFECQSDVSSGENIA